MQSSNNDERNIHGYKNKAACDTVHRCEL